MDLRKEIIVQNNVGTRIDSFLANIDEKYSRARAQKLLKDGKILVNDSAVKGSYKVKAGDKITVIIDEPKETDLKAEEIPLDVIYEDDDIIVVNKAKGMVVHPGNGNPDGTLVNAVLAHCKGNLSGVGGELRPGIVHRIDKDTSGLLIVAKNDEAHVNMSEEIKNHEVTKIYTALVKGVIAENKATINMPIARSQNDRKKMAVSENGKEAVTHFEVIKRYDKYTLLKVKIDTGRTHQIRVHMAQIGYPVVGDEVYSNGKNEFGVHGQMLHSTILEFKHPVTGKEMHLEAPLPKYFKDILNELDNR